MLVKNPLIYDDAVEKKTLPELRLKENIINAQEMMLISERKMMNRFRYNRNYSKIDLIEYEGNILLLFGFIKRMILDKGINRKSYDFKIYSWLCEAEKGRQFDAKYLTIFKNFLLKYLHTLNLANLFMSSGKSFEQKFNDSF